MVAARQRFLTGKYERGVAAASGTRAGAGNPMHEHIFGDLAAKEQDWDVLDAVRGIASELDVTPAQVSLAWVANRPTVIAPIIGARTLAPLEANLVAADSSDQAIGELY